MRGENRSLPWLANAIADHCENVYDDIDMGTVTAETLRQAKIVRDYAICIVDRLTERGVRDE